MINAHSDDHARELMFGYMDDSLTDEQVTELDGILMSTPSLRTEFAQLVRTGVHLRELGERRRAAARVAAPVRRQARGWLGWFGWRPLPVSIGLACVAAVLVLGLFLFAPRVRTPLGARLETVTGTATVERSGRSAALSAGFELAPGDRVRLEPKAAVTIGWGAVTCKLSNEADVSVEGTSTKGLVSIRSGTLAVRLEKSAASPPVRIHSVVADAVSDGAEFAVTAGPEATRVEVEAGTVRVTRLADGAVTEVAAGQFTVAQPGAPLIANQINPNDGRVISGRDQPK